MFSTPEGKQKAKNAGLFSSNSNETLDIFQNLSLESVKEARRKALQSRPSSPRLAGINLNPEILSDIKFSSSLKQEVTSLASPVVLQEPDQTRLHEKFRILKLLGEGHFGKVYKVAGQSDLNVSAVKISKKQNYHRAIIEAEILGKLSNGGFLVPKLIDSWVENKKVVIQMEHCEQSMARQLEKQKNQGQVAEGVIRSFICNIVPTLGRLHNMGYAHMDIKPENILLSQKRRFDAFEGGYQPFSHGNTTPRETVKTSDGFSTSPKSSLASSNYLLADFGLCTKIIDSNFLFDVQEGDKAYLPLEMLRGALCQSSMIDLTKVDIFAFGLVLLQLMTGVDIPTKEADWNELRTRERILKLVRPTSYSSRIKELVVRCLSPEPAERPSTSQILASLVDKREFLAKSLDAREELRLCKRIDQLNSTRASSPLKRDCCYHVLARSSPASLYRPNGN